MMITSLEFTGFQWDALILEANMLALPLTLPMLPNCWLPALMFPNQLLMFKVMFGSGLVKHRSRCPRWANSTAMDVHYETQPLPHLVSWYMHRLPGWFHAQECWIAFLIQLPMTLLQWGTWHCRLFCFLGFCALMGAIASTGSYGFFNIQVLGVGLSVLDDSLLPISLSTPCDPLPDGIALILIPGVMTVGLWIGLACGFSLLDLPRLGNIMDAPPSSWTSAILGIGRKAHDELKCLGIGMSYGPFAAMTVYRWELIFHLSNDCVTWEQIEFPCKPGCINTKPQMMCLGHFARLDWKLWFVSLGMGRGQHQVPEWVEDFIAQLLRGSPNVVALTLLNKTKTMASPPRFIRMSVWDYHFASCDPKVHQCHQVTITSDEHEIAYMDTVKVKSSDDCVSLLQDAKLSETEWGRWWYRRLIRHCAIYYLEDGVLHSRSDTS